MTLSRRDEFAKAAMQGWIAGVTSIPDGDIGYDDDRVFAEHQAAVAQAAVSYADALIARLDETDPKAVPYDESVLRAAMKLIEESNDKLKSDLAAARAEIGELRAACHQSENENAALKQSDISSREMNESYKSQIAALKQSLVDSEGELSGLKDELTDARSAILREGVTVNALKEMYETDLTNEELVLVSQKLASRGVSGLFVGMYDETLREVRQRRGK